MLLYMLFMPWLIVLFIRFVIPSITNWLAMEYDFGLEAYYPLLLSFFIMLQIPMIFGLVFGFLILDEKDDHILTALKVTPISVDSYIYYRFIVTVLKTMFFIMLTLPVTGIMNPLVQLPSIFPAILAGVFSVIILLLLVSLANNKVEGLAIMKGFGILMLGPMAAYFIESRWQLLLGLLPSYWPAKVFWLITQDESYGLYFIVGLAYNLSLSFLLYKRFMKKISNIG